MLKAYKYRIYPNQNQRIFFEKTFGCTRLIYNLMLADKKSDYALNKNKDVKSFKKISPAIYKSEYEFLKEVDSLALSSEWVFLNSAFRNFFRDPKIGFPKFKSKKNDFKSYKTNNVGNNLYIENNKLKLPKLKTKVKLRKHRNFFGRIISCTISKTPTNKYYAAVVVDEEIKKLPKLQNKLGIDVGIKEFCVTSNNQIIHNPKHLKKSENRLKKLQRVLSKKKLKSKNRIKARLRVSKIHEKIANQRKDFLHKLSINLIRENQSLVIENLSIKNLMKNSKLAKSIADVSWSEFRRLLEYKALWYDRDIIIAPSNYPSSQLCSHCGNKSSQTKNLKCRTYICPVCGLVIDRDYNASLNLLKLAA